MCKVNVFFAIPGNLFTYNTIILFQSITKLLPLYFSQVALRDLQMRGMPSNLLPGEPLCSPRTTVLLESTVQLLRRLHQCDQWASHINQYIHTHLELIGPLLKEDDLGSFNSGQTQLRQWSLIGMFSLLFCE